MITGLQGKYGSPSLVLGLYCTLSPSRQDLYQALESLTSTMAALSGFARSGEGETDRAGEAAGLLAEVSSLPSPIGSQGINSYSLVENSEL